MFSQVGQKRTRSRGWSWARYLALHQGLETPVLGYHSPILHTSFPSSIFLIQGTGKGGGTVEISAPYQFSAQGDQFNIMDGVVLLLKLLIAREDKNGRQVDIRSACIKLLVLASQIHFWNLKIV